MTVSNFTWRNIVNKVVLLRSATTIRHYVPAVTKSGTGTWDVGRGTWDLGREDSGTPGRGTRGHGDLGLGDAGTWGRGTRGRGTRGRDKQKTPE